MSRATRVMSVCVGALLMYATAAQAGPLPSDPNALGGFSQGTTAFIGTNGPLTIKSNVEFAVYAPGKFDLSFGAGADPSGGSQYVYAYEVFNTGVGGLDRAISLFTVALQPTALAQNIEFLPHAFGFFGQDPVSSSFGGGPPPTSARWDYSTATVPIGGNTQILLFTSPKGPTLQSAGVQGGGVPSSNVLPSPIPEPASWTLLVIGSVALAYRRVVARRRVG